MADRIVIIGSINMDLVCRTRALPRPGETVLGGDFHVLPGGKGANQAVAAARLAQNAEVHMIGRVGDDDFGRELLAGLRKNRVNTERVAITRKVSSGVAMILVDQRGENSIVVAPGANAKLTPADIDAAEPLIRKAAVVVMQLEIPMPTVHYAIRLCKRHGIFTILDPAPAPRPPVPRDLFPVDLLTPNLGEAQSLAGAKLTPKNAANRLHDLGGRTVALKLGARGSMLYTRDGGSATFRGHAIRAIDTTAAGDAFTAALALAHAEGMDAPNAMRFANAAGAVCCRKFGAQPSLPTRRAVHAMLATILLFLVTTLCAAADKVRVDQTDQTITATWPINESETGLVKLNLAPSVPLIDRLAIGETNLLTNCDPAFVLTVGTRNLSDKAGWIAFFDNPPKRPHQAYRLTLDKKSSRVESHGDRATIIIGNASAGPFSGDVRFTFFPGTRIVQVEAVMSTDRDACAILYDAGLVSNSPDWRSIAWTDTSDRPQQNAIVSAHAGPMAVRNRALAARCDGGAVAIFPPPHQFLYPLDSANNFEFTWFGRGWRDLIDETGFGVRQTIDGDGRYVPWVNAPPKTKQHLGFFLLLTRGDARGALDEVRRYTRNDRFKHLDGYTTFTSHYHVEHTLDVAKTNRRDDEPGFVKTFKRHGIDIVHLAEFHVGHTPEMNAKRLELLKLMHDECARLSDEKFLLLPGEEPNVHLGGHWISVFPKPVYWTLQRAKDQPFSEQIDGYGTVYHVGSAADVLKLMEQERGLMWTAHPRIKSSFGFPDAQRKTDFFASDRFLGAAWKAMPADYSHPRLGMRVLDLFDDMCNWNGHKQVLGEVDVFKVEPDYELYGHMNVNYVKLAKIPRFADGWQPVLDALRGGEFFVTTGEVLIPSCTIDLEKREVRASVEWTFPLAFAEVISGDGSNVYRDRIELDDTPAFGSRELRIPFNPAGRKWARLEVWDIAANGAFTQPVWLKAK